MRSKALFYGIFFAPVGIIAGLIIYGLATAEESKEFGWQLLVTSTITLVALLFGPLVYLNQWLEKVKP